MRRKSETPNPEIIVRHLAPSVGSKASRYWMGGSPFYTYLFCSFSIAILPAESFIIRGARAYQDQVTDPTLKERLRLFLAQEAAHSMRHKTFNQGLDRFDVPVWRTIARHCARMLERDWERSTPLERLALTAAYEHFTTVLGRGMLKEQFIHRLMDADVLPLFMWHSLEEVEHKDVAFSTFEAVGGTYWLRVRALLFATFRGMIVLFGYPVWFLRHDLKGILNVRNLRALWYISRFLSRRIPDYLQFFRPTFHPAEHDDSALFATWSQYVSDYTTKPRARNTEEVATADQSLAS